MWEFLFFLNAHTKINWLERSKTLYTTGNRRNCSEESFTQWQLASEMMVGNYIRWTHHVKVPCQFASSKGLAIGFGDISRYVLQPVPGLGNKPGEKMAALCTLKSSIFILLCLHADVRCFRHTCWPDWKVLKCFKEEKWHIQAVENIPEFARGPTTK